MFGWIKTAPERPTKITQFRVSGMNCGGCVKHVAAVLKALPGTDVQRVEIGKAVVSYNTDRITAEAIAAALVAAGYPATRENPDDIA